MQSLEIERFEWVLYEKGYVLGIAAYFIVENGLEVDYIEQMFAFDLFSFIEQVDSFLELLFRFDNNLPEHEVLAISLMAD